MLRKFRFRVAQKIKFYPGAISKNCRERSLVFYILHPKSMPIEYLENNLTIIFTQS